MNYTNTISRILATLLVSLALVSFSCDRREDSSADRKDHGDHKKDGDGHDHDDHKEKSGHKDESGDHDDHDAHKKDGDGREHDEHKEKSGHKDESGDHDDHDAHKKDGDGHEEGEDEHDEHGHGGHDDHAEEKTGAEFSKTKGILMHEEAAEVIQLKTAKAYKENLALEFTATARVYQVDHKHPADEAEGELLKTHALATAIITPAQADMLEQGHAVVVQHVGMRDKTDKGILVRLDRSTAQATGQVEALIAIPASDHKEEFGSFLQVTFSGKALETTAIPKSALLNAATGNFVYVEHEGRYLRTPVEVGTIGSKHIGITKGVEPGDVVVSNGTVGLWLIELRFTKGGGHSH
jgi:hypothetical protein